MTHRQVFEKKDVAILDGHIYRISDNLDCFIKEAQHVIDKEGHYIIPGLIDCHMHIESSMTYPAAFSKAALTYGTTTVVSDPHEMANVFGVDGVLNFMNQDTELDIYYAVPSSVPSTSPEIETSGASLNEQDISELLDHDNVICLGEVMNFSNLISEDDTLIKRIIQTCQGHPKGLKIEGHCPKLTPDELAAFIRAGVDSDHTQQTPESLVEKIDAGMFMELQKKSLSKALMDTIRQHHLYESIALITDDIMPDDLLKGHLNQNVQLAITLGMPFEKAIYCATYTPARRMQLYDRGQLAPGKIADFIILEDKQLTGNMDVYKSGHPISNDHIDTRSDHVANLFPHSYYHSVHCNKADPSDFELYVSNDLQKVTVNVMQLSYEGTFTQKVSRTLSVLDGKVQWQEAGLSLAVIYERYTGSHKKAYGLIENALNTDNSGAIATTWSHDSHNLLVIGNNPESMRIAQHRVLELQGGYCVAKDGRIIGEIPLPIGGIVSDAPIKQLGQQVHEVREAIESLGYSNQNVIMSVSTLALVVSPELKLTDNGLFNVRTYTFEPLIIEEIEG